MIKWWDAPAKRDSKMSVRKSARNGDNVLKTSVAKTSELNGMVRARKKVGTFHVTVAGNGPCAKRAVRDGCGSGPGF